jgi:Highly conserved protein containing a thioredoxin domain
MILKLFQEHNITQKIVITKYIGSHPAVSERCKIDNNECSLAFDDCMWKVKCNVQPMMSENSISMLTSFYLEKGSSKDVNVALSLRISSWSKENYVLMPAAAYNGNRFKSWKTDYPPQFKLEYDLKANIPTIITDVPRLNIDEGPSRIQLLAGDMSTPAIGYYDPMAKKGFWLLTGQNTVKGETGISIQESEDRSWAEIVVSAPGIRQDRRYTICNSEYPSEDMGAVFNEGDVVDIHIRLYSFDCPDIQALFDYFTNIRKDITGKVILHNQIPFSQAWKILETKYNEQNWENERGYYSVGLRSIIYQDWQVGWVGGLMSTLPMLLEGSTLSKERALKNLEFVFEGGQSSSGFFKGCGHLGKWYGDNFDDPEKSWHLIRKSSDALYFLIKQFMLLNKINPEFMIPEKWLSGTRKCADAFVRLWKRYGQFGQFVDTDTGDIIVGGSASGGIAPAGLTLASEFYGDREYLHIAIQVAEYYYDNYVKKGITTGGPGEILQCPDSESAFGLLESFVALYEITGGKEWLDKARDMANQCFTWCVSYDFKFPSGSTFGKLGMHTAGSVYANVQNKHSAPAICTLSGDSLFKLYRATGDKKYLELLAEIAHNLPQYLSRADRPVLAWNNNIGLGDSTWQEMPAGWMCERVNMSDWLEPVGEIFYGSCWCEVTNMLTYAEVPGLYIQPDTGFICTIDHIEARIVDNNEEFIEVEIINPTKYKACVKVLAENTQQMADVLERNWMVKCPRVIIESEKSYFWRMFKQTSVN